MRQAGVIAAAGLVGLTEHASKLVADHARAKSLARRLRDVPGVIDLDPDSIGSNIVFFDLDSQILDTSHFLAAFPNGGTLEAGSSVQHSGDGAALRSTQVPAGTITSKMELSHAFSALVRSVGHVAIGAYGHGRLRAVTHHQVTDDDIDRLVEAAQIAAKLLSAKRY
jgi:threonine aldolase